MRRTGDFGEIAWTDHRREDTDGFAYLAGAAVVIVCVGLGEAGEVVAREGHGKRQVTHTWYTVELVIVEVAGIQYNKW